MTAIGPFWRYYGGKWRAATLYEPPQHGLIIEPFAGAAGYSCHHYTRDVLLIDANPDVVDCWRWLIGATPSDVLALPPSLEYGQAPDDLDLPPGARLFLRWWCNNGAAATCRTASKWAAMPGKGWNRAVRSRVSRGVAQIKHWSVMLGTYRDAPDLSAHWFVDPPYQGKAGSHYRFGSEAIDYADLSAWCRNRRGSVVVCEGPQADWLPFVPFATIKANESRTGGKRSIEVVWRNFEPAQSDLFG